MDDSQGIEVWRGGVNAWELDNMGHMNVRFYGQRVVEGLVGLAAALGMPDAFSPQAESTLLIREQHIRFLREARSGAAITMRGAVESVGESEARLVLQLFHAHSGERAATYQLLVDHVTAREGRPFPWPRRMQEAAEGLTIEPHDQARPRSVSRGPVEGSASLEAAQRLDLAPMSIGAFGAQDCDVFGRMSPELVIARISDGMPTLMAGSRPAESDEGGETRRIGGAVLEYRLIHWAWPRAGDRFEVRSGFAGVEDKSQRLVHWMLDPATGRPWATAEAVAISLDLDARKIVPFTGAHRAYLESRVVPGLAL